MKTSVLPWQITFSLFLIFLSFSSTSSCPADQRSLLLDLRASLIYNESRSQKLVTWTPHSPKNCCRWSGITCDAVTGEVVGLDLSSESLLGVGGVNDDSSDSPLFRLLSLRSLNLANNSLTNSSIPDSIAALSELTYLNLSDAGFSGQVPAAVGKLRNLEVLDLSSSSLLYYGAETLRLGNPDLGELMENLSELVELWLDGVSVSETEREWGKAVAASLRRKKKLRVLSMVNCNLTGGFDRSLAEVVSLELLRLDQNNLSGNVPEFLADFDNLTLLSLSYCGLRGVFPERIFGMSTMVVLDLSDNPSLKGTLPEFKENRVLQELDLHRTGFSGRVPESIGLLKGLRKLRLSNCEFSGKIPSSVGRLGELVYLDLQWNRFIGPLPSFGSAKNLTQLVVNGNELSGSIEDVGWRSLSRLVVLDLSNNSLSGSIPRSMFSIPSLQKLLLQQNGFNGELGESLEVTSGVLDTVDLSQNELEGPVPKPFFGLQGLKSLTLSFNKFNGTLNLNLLQQLRDLSALDLSYNNLSIDAIGTRSNLSSFPQLVSLKLASCKLRELPSFLKMQSKLSFLDLSNNIINGAVPGWMFKVDTLNLSCNSFVSLEGTLGRAPLLNLDLHSNKLQGQLPEFPPRVTYLDLSGNGFNSTISSPINNFTVFLSLSKNNVSGSIPESLCSYSFLQILDLSQNQLHGSIPPCFLSLSRSLAVLNLRGNNLSGAIPEMFAANCNLGTLDLSENSLDGAVPRSLANCTQLKVLNLGRNRLNDTFPYWLWRSLSNLRVLVLRFNQFHGSISCPPDNAIWPLLQIVDLASNHFDGPLMAQCFLKWPSMTISSGRGRPPKLTPLQFSPLQYKPVYYQDMILVTFKGLELEVMKLLTVFTSLDFSNNNFSGEIPEALGNLSGLLILNFSHNALSGHIPSAIGNLSELESLDLSYNKLSGEIPEELVRLTFLSALSLAFNRLTGEIPTGAQFGTFGVSSFVGNEGLCGFPLSNPCGGTNGTTAARSENPVPTTESDSVSGFDWLFILTGAGFGMGMAIVVAPLMFGREGMKWYNERMDKWVLGALSLIQIAYTGLDDEESEREEEKDEEDDAQGDHFCVFCTKLDIERKRVIHDPMCTCHGSSTFFSSSSSFSAME